MSTLSLRAVVCIAIAAGAAHAQEALNMPAATQPAAEHFTFRALYRYTSLDDDPTPRGRTVDEHRIDAMIAYGITGELSATLTLPLATRRTMFDDGTPSDTDVGVMDPTAMLKWRFWKEDLGPVDTVRVSLLVGAELPIGDGVYTSGSVDPIIGGVITSVLGRHGLNGALQYTLTTDGDDEALTFAQGQADALRADASWLYRLSPEKYAEDTKAATYSVLELNWRYETNGDRELFLSPGLLYEAKTWAAEIGVQIPIEQSVGHRPETEVAIVAGLRFLF